eukprot:365680-Chlamydomonas_euryale.AAC.8
MAHTAIRRAELSLAVGGGRTEIRPVACHYCTCMPHLHHSQACACAQCPRTALQGMHARDTGKVLDGVGCGGARCHAW